MKNLSSKRAKACAISREVKKRVAERDSIDGWPCCIICGSPQGLPEAHYIPRSKGGLGIEQNIVTLCRNCHRLYDQGTAEQRETIGDMIRGYLKSQYINWNEENLVYRK